MSIGDKMKEEETRPGTFLSTYLEALSIAIITINTELRIGAANHAFEKTFGIKSDKCLGKKLNEVAAQIFSKKVSANITKHAREAIASGNKQELKKIQYRKADAEFVSNITINPLTDPINGKVMGATLFFSPTVEKERILIVEDEADVRKFLYDALSKEYTVITATDGLDAKEKLKETPFDLVIADLKMPKMSGKELIEYVHSDLDPHIMNIIITGHKEIWSPADASDQHVFHYFVKGEFGPNDLRKVVRNALEQRKSKFIEKDYFNQLTEMLSRSIASVTANLKVSNEILKRTKDRLETIINTMPDGLFTVDSTRKITSFNPMAEAITGYKASEVLGKKCSILRLSICEKKCPLLAKKREKEIIGVECQLISKDEEKIPILMSANVLTGHNNKIIGSVETIKDISELKRLEAILTQSAKMAGIGVLAAGIAHNLRSPMATIKAYPELMLDELKSNKLKIYRAEGKKQIEDKRIPEWLEIMKNSMTKCFGIINTLLSFSKVPSKEISHINLGTVIRDVEALVGDELTTHNIQLVKEVPEDIIVYGNLSQLTQIFVNLFTNAWQSMPNGGTLTVSAKKGVDKKTKKRYVGIQVKDTGCGIEEKYIDKIFEPFFTTKEEGYSIGMGLSLCYDIIQSYGGSISVASKPGKGATFTIKLPLGKSV